MNTPWWQPSQRHSPRPSPEPSLRRDQRRALQRARRRARLLDAQWGVGPLRFGLETLTDLLPGFGDFISLAASIYQLRLARQLRVPRRRRLQMGVNAGLDLLAGSVPVVGDVAGTVFKAHVRNQRIIDEHVETARRAA
jgi:hypothetical protein